MDVSIVLANLPLYFQGLWTTIWLVAAALALGFCLSIPLAVARSSGNPLLNWPVWAYTYFFRGTPLLIQLFMIYYGLGQFEVVQKSCVLAAAQGGVVLRAARLRAQHGGLHHRDPARRDRGHADRRGRGRQGRGDVAVPDAAADHPAERLPPRAAGLRQRGHLHAARQCRGQRGDDPRSDRRRRGWSSRGPTRPTRPSSPPACSTWS